MKKIIGIIFLVTMFTLNLTSFAEDNVTINAEVIEITENAFVNNGEEVIEKNSASETEGENAWENKRSMSKNRSGAKAFSINGELYVVGGRGVDTTADFNRKIFTPNGQLDCTYRYAENEFGYSTAYWIIKYI